MLKEPEDTPVIPSVSQPVHSVTARPVLRLPQIAASAQQVSPSCAQLGSSFLRRVISSKPLLDLSPIRLTYNTTELTEELPGFIYLGKAGDIQQHMATNESPSRTIIINANALNFYLQVRGTILKTEEMTFTPSVEQQPEIRIIYQLIKKDGYLYDIHNVFMPDTPETPVSLILNHIADIIHNGVSHMRIINTCNIYIACHAGVSRSPSLLLAYMAKYCLYDSLDQSLSLLRNIRPCVYPNLGFTIALQNYFNEQLENPDFKNPIELINPGSALITSSPTETSTLPYPDI